MIRRLAKAGALAAVRTGPGRRLVEAALRDRPQLAVEPVGQRLNRPAGFAATRTWPERLDGFEDLAFLFSSNLFNWGIAVLTFEEGAHLYRTVREVGPGRIAEIGRFKGGSTFLLAAGMHPESTLYSCDLHVKLTGEFSGPELDQALNEALRRYGLDSRVDLVVADSKTAEPPGRCKLVFVDGDHTYEGVRADYEQWRRFLEPGGHLVFHDAVPAGETTASDEEVARLVAEIERTDGSLVRHPAAGSLAHFVARPERPV